MPDQLQLRGGTTAQHTSFTGASKEVTVDTTKKTAVVHDGATAGGNPLLREDGSNSALSLGSAGTPSLKFTGDPNTGIYSPGADQVAISTNGTGRLFVDASGNVGVGTAPVVPLDIQQAQATQRLYSTTGTNTSHIQFRNTGGIAYVGLDSSTGGSFGAAYGLSLAHTGAYPITFVTNGNERMRLDSSGRLGLGTSSPAVQLHVAGTTAEEYMRVGPATGDPLTTKTIISSIYGDTTINGAGPGLRFWAGVTAAEIYGTRQDNGDGGALHLDVRTSGTLGTALYIDSSKRVGIGTTTPSDALQVASGNILIGTGGSSAGYRALYFGASSTASARFAYIEKNNDSPFDFNIVAQSSTTASSAINFKTTPTSTAATIDSSGRLLVGTSTSNQIGALDTQIQLAGTSGGTSLFSLQRYSNNSSSAGIYIGKSRGTSAGSFTAVQQDDVLGDIRFYGANGTDLSNLGAIIRAEVDGEPFTAGDTTDLPGRLVFLTTLDGAGSSTEAFRITNDRVRCYNQAAPAAVDTTATLTVANLKTGIITSSTAAAVTMTLPTGTDTEAGFSGVYTNMTFEWAVINTGATNAVTIAAGTGHTIVGSATVAASNSGRFATRRTAANTFVTYRLSS
jgi:hypothetical protein